MPAPIGADTVTTLSRSYIMPEVVDQVYRSNALFYRLNQASRKLVGGTHIEVPLLYSRFGAGGPYSGYDVLSIAPSDTVRAARYDWKQHHVPVVIDGLTLLKSDTPEAAANILKLLFDQARIEMCENLATGLFSDGTTNPKEITGLQLAVSDAGTYGQLARATYSWWTSTIDSSSTVLSPTVLNSAFTNAQEGGRGPTIIISQKANYNRYWALGLGAQVQDVGPRGYDEQLFNAGFQNMLFNGVPWVVDSHVHNSSTIYMLNEDFIHLVVSPRADFLLEPFQTPVDQDAMVAKFLWAGEFVNTNPARQTKLTAVTS